MIPLGLQLQALRRSPQGAGAMCYQDAKTREILKELDLHPDDFVYDDIFSGSDFLDLAEDLKLTSDDTTVSFSFDGAQLHQSKKSDTWIGVWIVDDYSPDSRYKKIHVLPAFIHISKLSSRFSPTARKQRGRASHVGWDQETNGQLACNCHFKHGRCSGTDRARWSCWSPWCTRL